MRYLAETSDDGYYYFPPDNKTLEGFRDADFGNCEDGKSVSGYAFFSHGCLISWSSTKQSTFAQSTSASEIVASSIAARELIWISKVLQNHEWELESTP